MNGVADLPDFLSAALGTARLIAGDGTMRCKSSMPASVRLANAQTKIDIATQFVKSVRVRGLTNDRPRKILYNWMPAV